jgi:hypothetical protein
VGFRKKHFPLLYLLSKAAPNRSATIFYGETTNRRLLERFIEAYQAQVLSVAEQPPVYRENDK